MSKELESMSTLANQIESYLKKVISAQPDHILEIRRGDLAEFFMCVPSQINYVLETRFGVTQGYLVESKRGGGGFVRIIKLSAAQDNGLHKVVEATDGRRISQTAGEGLLTRLNEEGFITDRENMLLQSLINSSVLKTDGDSEVLRGKILHSVLLNILRSDFENSKEE